MHEQFHTPSCIKRTQIHTLARREIAEHQNVFNANGENSFHSNAFCFASFFWRSSFIKYFMSFPSLITRSYRRFFCYSIESLEI